MLRSWFLANANLAEAANGTEFEVRIRKRKRDNFGTSHHQRIINHL